MMITSSPLLAVALYSTVMMTTLVPLSRASSEPVAVGHLGGDPVHPQTRHSFEFSTANRSKSLVCAPVTMGGRGQICVPRVAIPTPGTNRFIRPDFADAGVCERHHVREAIESEDPRGPEECHAAAQLDGLRAGPSMASIIAGS